MELEETLDNNGIYTDLQRYQEAKGAGDDDVIYRPNIIQELRKWGKYLLYINDGEEST